MDEDTLWIDVTDADTRSADRYAMVIEWSEEDEAFVVSAPDLPGLHTHGPTREEAATMGTEVIALWIAAAKATGESVPPPKFSALHATRDGEFDAARIRQIRRRLLVSQRDFAEMLNVSVATVRSWEQGLRTPDGAATRLLHIAEHRPDALIDAVSQSLGKSA